MERVDYNIDWYKFQVGSSFFIPCLKPSAAWQEMLPTFRRLRFNVIHKVVIEDGVRGIRVWRV